MDSTTKRRHECIKRFLIFNSGKKLRNPVHSCFLRNAALEEKGCNKNSNREEKERAQIGDNCYGCAFNKTFYYFSDAIKYYKSMLLSTMNEPMFIQEGYSNSYDWVRNDIIELFKIMLVLTQSMCYLTFKEGDRRALIDVICVMSPNELIKLVSDVCDFCNENNIK